MKYFQDIEDQKNLQELVLQDLKELGIKTPKVKKIKTGKEDVDGGSTGVFGTHLCQVQCQLVDCCGPIPKFLVNAFALLEKHITTEGLFRKSGSVARQKELKQKSECGDDFNDAQPNDVASLVKQFFRELPDPLLTSRLHDTFLKCHQVEPEHNKVAALLLLCHLLPLHHLSTLRFTMIFLRRVADQSEHNKMDVPNLAVCLAPNLLHTNSRNDKMNHTESKLLQIQTSIVQYLITNADCIGMVSDGLYERTTLMQSCFTQSEDELEKSDANINESKISKKKKKRSGSFQVKCRRRSDSFVSNLSNSFSKLRRDSKGHNQSTISDKSSMSIMALADKSAAREQVLDGAYEYDFSVDSATPKVIRKRKANEDVVPFSASKKKAILQTMPQMSTLGGNTPCFKTPAQMRARDGHDPGLMFPATPRMKMENMLLSPASATKVKRNASGKSSCFTPKTPKSNVRRKMKGLLRRLSGGKDAQPASPSTSLLNSSDVGVRLSGKDEPDYLNIRGDASRPHRQRRRKTPSSPARLVGELLSGDDVDDDMDDEDDDDDVQQEMGLDSSCSSLMSGTSSNPSITSLVRLRGKPQNVRSPATSSEISEEADDEKTLSTTGVLNKSGLRRGKPNTMGTGLPSPAKRRSMDPSSMVTDFEHEDIESGRVLATVDTSPIQSDAAMTHRNLVDEDDDPDFEAIKPATKKSRSNLSTPIMRGSKSSSPSGDDVISSEDEDTIMGLARQSSATSIMSTVAESDHDRAFIQESMLADLEEQTPQTAQESNNEFKVPHGIPQASSSQLGNLSTSQQNSMSYDSSDASSCTVIYNGQPVPNADKNNLGQSKSDSQLSSAKSMESIDSGIGCEDGKLTKSMSLQNMESSNSAEPSTSESFRHESSMRGRPNLQLSSETQNILSRAGMSEEQQDSESGKEIQRRRDSPHRFPQSQTRKRGVSPIRIPTIFAKADQEATQRYRELGRNAMRSSPKRKPNLPIGTGLVNAVSVRKARSRLAASEESAGTEQGNNAGSTPKHLEAKCAFSLKDCENAEQDPTPATPKIKPMLLSTDVTKRVLAVVPPNPTDTPARKHARSPIKPVKRLQGSPKSPNPRRYSTSPRKVMNKSASSEQRLSPLPKHMDDSWGV